MLFKTLILALLCTITAAQQYTFSGDISLPPCLCSAEAYLISLRWLQIFQTNAKGIGTGAAIVPSTLSPNFTYFDEGASFGKPGPYYTSADEVMETVSGAGYSGGYVTSVKYTVLDSFASCDTVTVRWQSDSKSATAKGV